MRLDRRFVGKRAVPTVRRLTVEGWGSTVSWKLPTEVNANSKTTKKAHPRTGEPGAALGTGCSYQSKRRSRHLLRISSRIASL